LQLALAAAFVSWLLSTYIHHPRVEVNIYSDVVSFWYAVLDPNSGKVPCVDYFFEYPPAACFITCVSAVLGGWSIESYYSLPSYLILAWAMSRYAGPSAIFFMLAPSMVVYGIYNFDHFFAALVALSLVLFEKRRWLAHLLLGIAASVKLFTILLFPVFLLKRDMRSVLRDFLFSLWVSCPWWCPLSR